MFSLRLLVVSPVVLFAKPCFADAVFHLWFEAPEEVNVGATFTLTAWAEVSGSILDETEGGFNSFGMNLTASGPGVLFSPAEMPFFATLSAGTPAVNALNTIVGINMPFVPPFYTLNPIVLFSTQVSLMGSETGVLQFAPSPTTGVDFMLAWWADYDEGSYVTDADPGSSLVVTSAVVRVIPAPISLVLLAYAGIPLIRRRR